MANLTEKEKEALGEINCSVEHEHKQAKALTLMAFIYTLIGYFIYKA